MSEQPVLNWLEKSQVLAHYFDLYQPQVVIETGLWNGIGSSYQFVGHAEVVVCDLEEAQCARAREQGVTWAVAGDTRRTLPLVLEQVHVPALFWLDSHKVVEGGDWVDDSPLLEELAAICAWPFWWESVLLIDDVRMLGRQGWPSLDDVLGVVSERWAHWSAEVAADIVRVTPRLHRGGGDADIVAQPEDPQ